MYPDSFGKQADFMIGILVVDIETVGDPDKESFLQQPAPVIGDDAPQTCQQPTEEMVPKSYRKSEAKMQEWLMQEATKRQQRMATWVIREREKQQEQYQDRVDKMPLDIDLALIRAIGFGGLVRPSTGPTGSGMAVTTGEWIEHCLTARTVEEEAAMLQTFWQFANPSRYGGYNIKSFDLPLLLRRSWVHRVQMPEISLRRYATDQVVDAMQLFYHEGRAPGPKYRGLKMVCDMYGIDNPLPELDGSQVAEMNDDILAEYCLNDVKMTWELLRCMHGYYWR